jgi:hypothetical protein
VRVPAWSCGFLSLLLNCFHQLARSRLDWTASLWLGRAGLGPPAMACAVDGLLVAIAEGVSGDDVRYAIAGWGIGGCDVQTSRYAARRGKARQRERGGDGRRRWSGGATARRGLTQRRRSCSVCVGIARGEACTGTTGITVRRGCLVVSRTHRARARKRAAGETGLWVAWVGLGGSAIAEDADHEEGVLPSKLFLFCCLVFC